MQSTGRVGLLLVWTILAMGCATTQTTATDRVACGAFSVISFSARDDSAETVRQVREHNAKWRAVCEPSS